jgi:hypothetical protein
MLVKWGMMKGGVVKKEEVEVVGRGRAETR